MSFSRLGLAPELLRAVADEGYDEPTPVQREAIPLVLAGRDLLASAQTGTGKTAAFVLPMLQRLGEAGSSQAPARPPTGGRARRGPVRVLVVEPTRELALQVEESVRTYGAHHPARSTTIYGGVGFEPQARALRGGPEIVVATPGRLLDHADQGTIDLAGVEILVLDEADRLLDMGFIRDIRRILRLLPERRQNLLFSATFSDGVRDLAAGLLQSPATVEVAARNTPADLVRQIVHPVDRDRKRSLLAHLVRSGRIEQALVFTRTKHGANRLAEQLVGDGIDAAAIHGNKSQSRRVRALGDFKSGRVAILVATDIAARGLDIESLPHVVNYELPMVASDYVHRIGRTGRAGTAGEAISLVCVDEAKLLREIEMLLGHWIPSEVVAGFEPDRSVRPEPIRLRSGGAPAARRTGGMPARSTPPLRGTVPDRASHAAGSPRGGGAPAGSPRTGGTAPARGHRPARPHDDSASGGSARQQHVGLGSRPATNAGGGHRPGRSSGSTDGRRHPGRVDALPGERFARHAARDSGSTRGR